MDHLRQPRLARLGIAALMLLTALATGSGRVTAQGTVEDPDVASLMRVLKRLNLPNPEDAARDPDLKKERDASLKERRQRIRDKVKNLRSLVQMGEALQLQEWQEEEDVADTDLRAIDFEEWTALNNQFEKRVAEALKSDNPLVARAAADLITDIAARDQKKAEERGLFIRKLMTPRAEPADPARIIDLLAQRVGGNGPEARVAAARALARLNPDGKTFREALSRLIARGDVIDRRGACGALFDFIRAKVPPGILGVEDSRKNISEGIAGGIEVVGPLLADSDAGVRREAAAAMKEAARALGEVIRNIDPELLNFGTQRLEDYRGEVEAEARDLSALTNALKNQFPVMVGFVSGSDATLSLTAADFLELVARARQKLKDRYESTFPSTQIEKQDQENKPPRPFQLIQAEQLPQPKKAPGLLAGFQDILPSLLANLSNQDLQIRLKTATTIEVLGRDILSAELIEALLKAQQDPNTFVRWATARTLGKLADIPRADAIVPVLADQLCTQDVDFRKAVAVALAAYGSSARSAVPALAKAATNGDSEARQAAILAIRAVGPEATEAIPALIQALKTQTRLLRGSDTPRADDALVRQAAAETLARFGPAAAAAVPALKEALNDPNAIVRKAAADALLSILMP